MYNMLTQFEVGSSLIYSLRRGGMIEDKAASTDSTKRPFSEKKKKTEYESKEVLAIKANVDSEIKIWFASHELAETI